MSNFTDDDDEREQIINEEVKVMKENKVISEAQRTARIENLRRGRLTRMKNIELKKQNTQPPVPSKAVRTDRYEVKHETASEDEDESSDSEEYVLSKKRKETPAKKRKAKSYEKNEIAELKNMILSLANKKKKPRARSSSTIINLPAQPVASVPIPVAKENGFYSDFYKSRILKL